MWLQHQLLIPIIMLRSKYLLVKRLEFMCGIRQYCICQHHPRSKIITQRQGNCGFVCNQQNISMICTIDHYYVVAMLHIIWTIRASGLARTLGFLCKLSIQPIASILKSHPECMKMLLFSETFKFHKMIIKNLFNF